VTCQDIKAHLRGRLVNSCDEIDLRCIDPAAARPTADLPDHPILPPPGRLLRNDGRLNFIRAARQLPEQGLPITVVLAGSEDTLTFVAELRRKIAGLGPESPVRFLGQFSAREIRARCQASLATVLPTYYPKGLSQVTLESQAKLTPVVAYSTGGIAKGIEQGKTVFLVPAGYLRTFVAAVARLLREPGRPTRIGEAGRRRVENRFTAAAMCRGHERFHRTLCSGPRVSA
jgi:colanic acid/amylovoran biosynthesis glycosyltransferase